MSSQAARSQFFMPPTVSLTKTGLLAMFSLSLLLGLVCWQAINGDRSYHEKLWIRYRLLGDRALVRKDYQQAIQLYKDALHESETFGRGGVVYNMTLNDIADALAMDQQSTKAHRYYQQVSDCLLPLWNRSQKSDLSVGIELSRALGLPG